MAVGEPDGFHPQFRCLLPAVDFVAPGDLDGLAQRLAGPEVPYAAFIFEPLVQGSAGMKMHSAHFLENAIAMCQARGVLAIADEVFTGFFRTGTCFAFEQLAATPDLVCLSKGLTGGFLPLAVTLASGAVHAAFLGRDLRRAFLHGHSYTANPLACAAANASWALLQEPATQARIAAIATQTATRVERLRDRSDKVADARGLGTIGAVELRPGTSLGDSNFSAHEASIAERAVARGVLLRPLGNVLYAVPPYCVTDGELDRIYDVMEEIIDEI
jgi:adenosylmethionine-8-amino-7-oxononanoate aminotransferase